MQLFHIHQQFYEQLVKCTVATLIATTALIITVIVSLYSVTNTMESMFSFDVRLTFRHYKGSIYNCHTHFTWVCFGIPLQSGYLPKRDVSFRYNQNLKMKLGEEQHNTFIFHLNKIQASRQTRRRDYCLSVNFASYSPSTNLDEKTLLLPLNLGLALVAAHEEVFDANAAGCSDCFA